jgi:hypothetical protein
MPSVGFLSANAVDWSNPIRWENPHLNGLVRWWKCRPNTVGEYNATGVGLSMPDLCGKANMTLTVNEDLGRPASRKAPGLSYRSLDSAATSSVLSGLQGYPLSFCGWANLKATSNRTLASMGEGGGSGDFIQLRFGVTYADVVVLETAQVLVSTANIPYVTNKWHFIAGGISASLINVYMDGDSNSGANTQAFPVLNNIMIGSRNASGSLVHTMNGFIDSVMVFKRYIDATEWRYFENQFRMEYGQELLRTADLPVSRAELSADPAIRLLTGEGR